MIDGYSVEEAASVLGVPEGRVWELLARGVLSGTPEGESMRVFLKAQTGPIATAGVPAEAPRTNGNGGSHATGEASPFRELLTEFRNLTERYGQALLALGESRGEVAGLRSRVDLLEARLDVRLPPAHDDEPVAWEAASPAPAAEIPGGEPVVASPGEPAAPRASRPRKARTSRSAVAGFAEALARAEDPAPAEVRPAPAAEAVVTGAAAGEALPVGDDAEPIVEALQDAFEVAAPEEEPEAAEATLETAPETAPETPEAAPAVTAEAITPEAAPPESATPESSYSADVVEPDWFADGDFAWLDVAELEARTAPSVADAEAEPATAAVDEVASAVDGGASLDSAIAESSVEAVQPAIEAAPAAEAAPTAEAGPTVEAAPTAEAAARVATSSEHAPEAEVPPLAAPQAASGAPAPPTIDAEPEPVPVDVSTLEAVAMDAEPQRDAGPEPWSRTPDSDPLPAQPLPAQPLPAPPLAGEEELMWLGARQEPPAAGHTEMEAPPPSRPTAVAAPERAAPGPTARPPASPSAVEPRPLALSEDELARLARDEGWDETEVAAIRAMIGTPAPSIELPGADELDVAMAAFEVAPPPPQADPSRQWAKAARERDEPVVHEEWAYESEPSLPPAIGRPVNLFQPPPVRRPTSDPGWLRSRRGPAATAYRRLRRLFPG